MKLAKRKSSKREALTQCLAGLTTAVVLTGVPAVAQDTSLHPTRMPSTKSVASDSTSGKTVRLAVTPVMTTSVSSVAAPSKRWLKTSTANATLVKARAMIEQARVEYASKAWVSCEESSWHALQLCAQAIDQSFTEPGSVSAAEQFTKAQQAITESRDFGGLYGPVDSAAINRIAKAHRTNLITKPGASELSAAQASEYYLDYARVELAQISADCVEAAEAMDMLAATFLARDEEKMLPNDTSLCLRRAALQGQPQNADLAARLGVQLSDVGLLDESQWALQHSLNIEYQPETAQRLVAVLRRKGDAIEADRVLAQLHQNMGVGSTAATPSVDPRVPNITRLSPQDFAALSGPVQSHVRPQSQPNPIPVSTTAPVANNTAPGARTTDETTTPTRNPFRLAAARLNITQEPTPEPPTNSTEADATESNETTKPGAIRRWFNAFRKN